MKKRLKRIASTSMGRLAGLSIGLSVVVGHFVGVSYTGKTSHPMSSWQSIISLNHHIVIPTFRWEKTSYFLSLILVMISYWDVIRTFDEPGTIIWSGRDIRLLDRPLGLLGRTLYGRCLGWHTLPICTSARASRTLTRKSGEVSSKFLISLIFVFFQFSHDKLGYLRNS